MSIKPFIGRSPNDSEALSGEAQITAKRLSGEATIGQSPNDSEALSAKPLSGEAQMTAKRLSGEAPITAKRLSAKPSRSDSLTKCL